MASDPAASSPSSQQANDDSDNSLKSVGIGFAYTSPRLIANSIQYIFFTYLGELYINSFKWKASDFGLLTSIFSSTLGVSHLLLGTPVNLLIEELRKASGGDDAQLKATKRVEVVSVLVHAVTFFFLIFLPIIWSGTGLHSLNLLFGLITRIFRRQTPGATISETLPNTTYEDSDVGLDTLSVPGRNRFLAFIFSKKFIIYMITIINGVAFTVFDLCNRSIPTDISKDDKITNTLNAINLGGYGITMLLINVIISVIKTSLANKVNDVDLFFILTIVILLLQLPVLYGFTSYTTKLDGPDQSKSNSGSSDSSEAKSPAQEKDKCCCKGSSSGHVAFDCIKLIAVIIFHASASFWFVTLGPLIQYLTANMLGEDEKLKNFGPFFLLATFTATTLGYSIMGVISSSDSKNKCCCKKSGSQSGKEATSEKCCICSCSKDSGIDSTQWMMTLICIFGQIYVYFIFFRYNFGWNRGNLAHFLLYGIGGAVLGVFFLVIGSMLDSVIKKDWLSNYKVIVFGVFFSLTHFSTSLCVYKLYKYYDQESTTDPDSSIINSSPGYSFTSVYKIITLIFQILNVIAVVGYYLEYVIERIKDALSKNRDVPEPYKSLAAQLNKSIQPLDKMIDMLQIIHKRALSN